MGEGRRCNNDIFRLSRLELNKWNAPLLICSHGWQQLASSEVSFPTILQCENVAFPSSPRLHKRMQKRCERSLCGVLHEWKTNTERSDDFALHRTKQIGGAFHLELSPYEWQLEYAKGESLLPEKILLTVCSGSIMGGRENKGGTRNEERNNSVQSDG